MPLAVGAGVMVSFGPCTAPRFIAVAALTARKPFLQSGQVAGSFVAGLTAVYVSLAIGGSLIWRLMALSHYTYLAVALLMGSFGVFTLIRKSEHCSTPPAIASRGGTFLLGASSAATVSPCCMPLLGAVIAYADTAGLLLTGVTAAAFALGHSAPLLFTAALPRGVTRGLTQASMRLAVQVVSGSLMLAVAAFYGILA